MSSLADLFPDGDYRFHLTLRKGEAAAFFGRWDAADDLRRERSEWIRRTPARYAALHPDGAPLLAEVAELAARDWGAGPIRTAEELAVELEPDVLLLNRAVPRDRDPADGAPAAAPFVLQGGALCFPTGWALEEKLGLTLDAIHGVVPGLNAALASPIQQFLARLRPGVVFHRDNWGIVASEELNLHPARALPPPSLPVALDRLWLRIEYQAFLALPRTKGIVFGIRIARHRLDTLTSDRAIAARLRHALATMPPAVAEYKRLAGIREELVACV